MDLDNMDDDEFGFSRNYFLAKESGGSGKKSARRISDINVVDEQELKAAVSNIPPKHEKEIAALAESYKSQYPEWVFQLRSGFGLLMYGFGSKKALVEDFASTALTDYTVVVINGYLPSINIKQVRISKISLQDDEVVACLVEILWDQLKAKKRTLPGNPAKVQQPFSSFSMDDLLAFLDGSEEDRKEKDSFICVVVNNIDGPGLRDADTQQYLARLASCFHIHIIASIDHVNAPLLWDKKMVHTQFNWHWHHVPTFAPYKVEGLFYPLVLAHGNTAQSAKTAAIVLQSLTPNAQNVFKILAEYQISHPDEDGMPIENLYSIARERFLLSSQVTLNSHLTEFKDHELIKTRRNSDGQECLYIPLATEALDKLLAEIS